MYKSIKLHEGVQYDYLYVDDGIVTDEEISNINSSDADPNWETTENPIIVAQFNENTQSSRIDGLSSALTHWSLYRQRIGENKQYLVATVDKNQLAILDYMCASQQEYVYTLVPILEGELGVSSSGDKFKPDWESYTIIGLDKISDNIYAPSCVWNFRYNLTPEAITHNIDVTTVETFTRYPKIISGDRGYVTTGLSCLIEDINCITDESESSPLELYEKWEEFVLQRKPCLFKNDIGVVKFGYIKDNPTFNSDFNYENNPSTISLSFVETGSVEDITVYDTPLDNIKE